MAEIVGGMLAAGLLKVAAGKVAAAAGDRVMLQWRFSEDLEEMKKTMESIEAVLGEAETRTIQDRSTLLWLKRLTSASNNISDMFEEFEVDTTRKSALRKLKVLNPCLTLTSEIRMAGNMKKVRGELEKISSDRDKFSFNTSRGSSSNEQKVINQLDEIWPLKVTTDILGRNEEKQKVIDLLMKASSSSEFVVLPIYGIGGIGKTTLANLIYNDKQFKDYKKAWVFVSQTFVLKKIHDSISSELQKEQSQLANTLESNADRKKILIVLDDIWEKNPNNLNDLRRVLLEHARNGCKVHVIVTTRDADIARKMKTNEAIYNIELLSPDMCWAIMKQQIGGFEDKADKESLEVIGKEIAEKCGGVALAARTLGNLLKSKDFNEWVLVKDSCLWKFSMPGDTTSPYDPVYASLNLSFSGMNACLRLCFAYCAIFPKGHKMVKDDLIYQWAALGFLEPSPQVSALEHGESYINQLVGLSFFQHSDSPSSDGSHVEEVTFFTMHDLVHDLAMLIMGDEVLDPSKKDKTRNCRFASLADCSKPLNSFLPHLDKIRALHLVGDYKVGQCDAGFSIAKYLRLRVLDLRESSIHKLPSSIGKLKLLRYLNAPGIQDRMTPSCITKLSKLIYLNLSGSVISALPELIGDMENLMYLNLSGCSEIRELPESFGKLKNLVHLDFSKCAHVTRVSEFLENLAQLQYLNLSFCKKIGEAPVALGSLTKLQYLNLSCSSYFIGRSDCDVLSTLTNLEHLNLSSTEDLSLKTLPEALGSFTKLKYLNLAGCTQLEIWPSSFERLINLVHLDLTKIPVSTVGNILEALSSLTKLRYLSLSSSEGEIHWQLTAWNNYRILRALPGILALTELRYLNLANCVNMDRDDMSFLRNISTLSNLEHLDLSGISGLQTIPDSLCSLSKLHTLNLTGCESLRRLPANIVDMDSLKFLIVKYCWGLDMSTLRINKSLITLPNFAVHAAEGEQSSSLVLLKDVTPGELEISGLENVKSVQETHIIELRKKQSIEVLTLEWTKGKKGNVEDLDLLSGLIPPSSLKEFVLQGYNSKSFPTWLLMGIANYLPNLTKLWLIGLPQCSSLPAFGQLPNLQDLILVDMPKITKIDKEFCGGEKAFAKVTGLIISYMESLEEWSVAWSSDKGVADEFMFPNLECLTIRGCHKLKLKPRPPRATKLWSIEDSDDVLLQWGDNVPDTSSSTSSALVAGLWVRSCMAPMHQWKLLHHLPALDKLIIENCNDPSGPLEMAGVLCSLRELRLEACHSMTSLPEWVGHLTALQSLSIHGGQKLISLHEDIRHLTKLRKLWIRDCSDIQALPEQLGDLVSLECLQINNCTGIVSFPESIQQLTNLRKLKIWKCSGIQALPEQLGDLASLESLSICACTGIVSFPESIQQLTNLRKLKIWDCPALRSWCESEDNVVKIGHIKEIKIDHEDIWFQKKGALIMRPEPDNIAESSE